MSARTWTGFRTVLWRDLLLAFRQRSQLANPVLFFVVVTSLFPLAISPNADTLRLIAPGVIWVAALLATLLSLDNLFRSDFDDGSLEQLLVSGQPLGLMVLAKVAAHWLTTGVPLIVCSPLLALMLHIPLEATPVMVMTLLLGTPVLSLVGAIGVGLTVGLRRGGALLSLLVLPLYIPVLIFGANAVDAASAGLNVTGQLYILGAMLALALTFAPLAAAACLRITVN